MEAEAQDDKRMLNVGSAAPKELQRAEPHSWSPGAAAMLLERAQSSAAGAAAPAEQQSELPAGLIPSASRAAQHRSCLQQSPFTISLADPQVCYSCPQFRNSLQNELNVQLQK